MLNNNIKVRKTRENFKLNLWIGLFLIIGLLSFQSTENTNEKPINITKEQVKQAFKATVTSEVHPRLFFNKNDIDRINQLYIAKDPIITLGYNQMKRSADNALSKPLLEYKLDEANLRISSIHSFSSQLADLVLMFQLTKDKKYAEKAWAQLEKMIDYPDWGANRHFLDSGIACFEFALAYDGLFDYLSNDQKKALKDAVLKQVFNPGKELMDRDVFWHNATYNWNGICNGGLIVASLTMFEDNPEYFSGVIAQAASKLPNYINEFNPDGQGEEGVGYWNYGLRYTSLAFEDMQRLLGTTFKIDDQPGFKKTGWFPIYMSGPVTTMNFGDDAIKKDKVLSMFWFAKQNKDAELAKRQYELCLQNKSVFWTDMVYYDPKLVQQKSTKLEIPKEVYIKGIEVMSLRENWSNDGLFVGMHGGDNNANHGHLDAGTFEIQGLGKVWANGGLGSDKYTYPGYFKKTIPDYTDKIKPITEAGRWHFYRLRAEGKNCIVINPDSRPDQNPHGVAKLLEQGTSENDGFYFLDLTECYNRDVSSYLRGIKLNRANRTIEVQDEIKALKRSTIWWSMHTKANIGIADDGRTAVLTIGDQKMVARIVGEEDAKFCELPATYLPTQSFPLTINSLNEGFRKLAIQLTDVKDVTIRVDFTPMEAKYKNEKIKFLTNWKDK